MTVDRPAATFRPAVLRAEVVRFVVAVDVLVRASRRAAADAAAVRDGACFAVDVVDAGRREAAARTGAWVAVVAFRAAGRVAVVAFRAVVAAVRFAVVAFRPVAAARPVAAETVRFAAVAVFVTAVAFFAAPVAVRFAAVVVFVAAVVFFGALVFFATVVFLGAVAFFATVAVFFGALVFFATAVFLGAVAFFAVLAFFGAVVAVRFAAAVVGRAVGAAFVVPPVAAFRAVPAPVVAFPRADVPALRAAVSGPADLRAAVREPADPVPPEVFRAGPGPVTLVRFVLATAPAGACRATGPVRRAVVARVAVTSPAVPRRAAVVDFRTGVVLLAAVFRSAAAVFLAVVRAVAGRVAALRASAISSPSSGTCAREAPSGARSSSTRGVPRRSSVLPGPAGVLGLPRLVPLLHPLQGVLGVGCRRIRTEHELGRALVGLGLDPMVSQAPVVASASAVTHDITVHPGATGRHRIMRSRRCHPQ
ncbi:hypothetical protein [Micromonospora sp. NBRC 101691]|uniref:hypothetical protein n=1 Tax=Micromonospora sp. NBRC 101691 TaxID=3032198 RepID=UPI0025545B31|nr:hypothetical protein [Micromonospora sp. NBRC 101691]